MTFRDLLIVSTGNLRRMKLRTFLTTAGIIIAITAFVAMLSFGAGSQEKVEDEFNNLGLFTTMQVYPLRQGRIADTTGQRELDLAAIEQLEAIPGVNLVYPYDALNVQVRMGDSVKSARAQALPLVAMQTKLHSRLEAGSIFEGDSARQVILSQELARQMGFPKPDSALGQRLIVSARVSTLDSALAHLVMDRGESILSRLERIDIDSLFDPDYRSRIVLSESNELVRRFVNGFVSAQETISDTLTVCGIRQGGRGGPLRADALIIPVGTARRFSSRGPVGGATELVAAMSRGSLFGDSDNGRTFPQVTMDINPRVPYKQITDSVQALGFRAFSFAQEFEQMRQFFLYFDVALGVIGMIALLTASLGIVNTMVMSITERRKEIGILKSLGAHEGDIRGLFLVESGLIGAMGTVVGIVFGWLVTRIVSFAAQAFMRSRGMEEIDLFSLPAWLLLIAIAVGVGVSVLAGSYPASRAARVDPVEALRGE